MGDNKHRLAGPQLSLVGVPGGAAQRPSGQRPRLFRVSRVAAGGSATGLARVLRLSDDEMLLSTRLQPMLGEQWTVDVSDLCSLTGTVIWTRPGQCGIKLTVPIDAAALMQRLAEERATTQRRRRWRAEKRVVVRSALGLQIVRLRDVSPTEARIVHDGRFQPGMMVKLQLAPGVERPGILSWSRDGIAGVALADMLDTDQRGVVART